MADVKPNNRHLNKRLDALWPKGLLPVRSKLFRKPYLIWMKKRASGCSRRVDKSSRAFPFVTGWRHGAVGQWGASSSHRFVTRRGGTMTVTSADISLSASHSSKQTYKREESLLAGFTEAGSRILRRVAVQRPPHYPHSRAVRILFGRDTARPIPTW